MLKRAMVFIFTLLFLTATTFSALSEDEGLNSESSSSESSAESEESNEQESYMILPAGTPVSLIMNESLYSQRNREGDEIIFTVSEDIVFMKRTYICAGTPVIGRVIGARAAKSWGRGGKLDIDIRSLAPSYGMPIALTSELETTGGSKKAGSIVTTALLGISVVGLLAGGSISGSGAVIEAGTSITVYTAEDGKLLDIPVDEMRASVDDWLKNKVIQCFLNYRWDKNKSVEATMTSMGYTIDESAISISPLGDYHYDITVPLGSGQTAEFEIQPFEEPHIGKFITIEGLNELAEQIIKAVEKSG